MQKFLEEQNTEAQLLGQALELSFYQVKSPLNDRSGGLTAGCVPKDLKAGTQRGICAPCVHSSIAHNGQKLEATQGLVDSGGCREVVPPHDGILFRLKEEGCADTCDTRTHLEDVTLSETSQSQKDR